MTECCSVSGFKELDGIWDISRSISSSAGYMLDYLPLSKGQEKFASTVAKTTGVAAFPQFVSKAIDLSSDYQELSSGKETSYQPLVMDGLGLIGTTCDCISAANNLGWVDAGKSAPVLGPISDAITVVTDGADFFTQKANATVYQKKMENKTLSPKTKEYYEAKITQAHIRQIKRVISVAMAIFCLLALVFTSLVMAASLLITASVIYVILNLTDYFYSRSIEDSRKVINSSKASFC